MVCVPVDPRAGAHGQVLALVDEGGEGDVDGGSGSACDDGTCGDPVAVLPAELVAGEGEGVQG